MASTAAMGGTEDPNRDPEMDSPAPGAGVLEDCAWEAALSGAAGAARISKQMRRD
jgi:hypothetical protein